MPTAPTTHPTPDPLMETELFWARHKVPIVFAMAAIIVAAAAYGAYQYRVAQRDTAAAGVLAQAKSAENYHNVIADYPSTPAAASACLLLAAEERKAEKFAEANATLQKFLEKNPKHELVTSAKMAMAANLESLNKTDEALETYRRLAADYPRDFNAPLAMLAEVPILKRTGKADEARKVCETILTQYRESYASTEATQQLRQLKPAEEPQPATPPASGIEGGPAGEAESNAAPLQAGEGASVPPVAASPASSAAPTP